MREITIDGRGWTTADDFYDAFFKAVEAPSWHGRNFNALRDSVCLGQINKIEVPYVLRIKNYSSIGHAARGVTEDFVSLVKELRDSGCAVDIVVEN
jgi:RNAse (barnase) inhibitor barstar